MASKRGGYSWMWPLVALSLVAGGVMFAGVAQGFTADLSAGCDPSGYGGYGGYGDCDSTGRMTGGGSVGSGRSRVSHGFVLHCDPAESPNVLQVNWRRGNRFRLTHLSAASCSTDPGISSGQPDAGFNTYVGSGVGLCNGELAYAEWTFTDAGEPGVDDYVSLDISGGCDLSISGTLGRGNHQAHRS